MNNVRLVQPDENRLGTLFSWFDSDDSVLVWGGPGMRLPMTLQTLKVDAKLDSLASYFLLDAAGAVSGFGQFYQRLDHCHLGRLIIAPSARGKGLGQTLIDKLSEEGLRSLKLGTQSLFVLKENVRAEKLYERLGFIETTYPGTDIDVSRMLYMVRLNPESN